MEFIQFQVSGIMSIHVFPSLITHIPPYFFFVFSAMTGIFIFDYSV